MQAEISRRDLIKAALAAGLTVVGTAGCNSEDEQTSEQTAESGPSGTTAIKNADGTATVPGGGKLENGTAMTVTLPDQRPMLLFKTKTGEVRALSALCTHNQCTIAWDGDKEKLKCPCHGSVFAISGKPEKGPAAEPLKKYQGANQGR